MTEPMDDVEAVAKAICGSKPGLECFGTCEGCLLAAEAAIAALAHRLSAAKEEGMREGMERAAKIAESCALNPRGSRYSDFGAAREDIAAAIRKEASHG